MSSTYGRILRIPGAAAFSVAGLLARFPMSMQGIATILAVQALYGSYSPWARPCWRGWWTSTGSPG